MQARSWKVMKVMQREGNLMILGPTHLGSEGRDAFQTSL